jgi:hypothetical protein
MLNAKSLLITKNVIFKWFMTKLGCTSFPIYEAKHQTSSLAKIGQMNGINGHHYYTFNIQCLAH